jgi:hypothetical protein
MARTTPLKKREILVMKMMTLGLLLQVSQPAVFKMRTRKWKLKF